MKSITTLEFTSWLEQFINFERWPQKEILNLQNMLLCASHFGNPQNAYKSVHIAGSKGKGSCSVMISSILSAYGFKTGLYTSPHVMDFRERVSLAGTFFSDDAYSKAYTKVMQGFEVLQKEVPSLDPSWFEIVTLLAFLIFKDEGCLWGVFETGMGGRLDTTNVLLPECSVLTPIELEHCQYLGNTKEKIAGEKAGIIKSGKPVFCSEQEDDVLKVFIDRAEQMQSPFFYLPNMLDSEIEATPSLSGLEVSFSFKHSSSSPSFKRPIKVRLAFIDTVQAKNAALAALVTKHLIGEIDEETIERGLSFAWLPGRFEVLSLNEPLVIVDGAHTEKSISYCVETYRQVSNQKKAILLFACADDKETQAIAPLFSDVVQKIYITIPGTFKKSNITKTSQDFQTFYKNKGIECISSIDYQNVIRASFEVARNTNVPLLITGSFYLVAEAKKIISPLCEKAESMEMGS